VFDRTIGTVIIGGGIAGVALAYYLADLGEADIVVVDAHQLASGATGSSIGGVRQQFSTPSAVVLALRGREFWQTFEERFDYPCRYHQDGYLVLTGHEDTFEQLVRAADVQRSVGANGVEQVTATDVAEIAPWLSMAGLIGGFWTPEDGRANAAHGVHGLSVAARKLGVAFRENVDVARIQRRRGEWVLHAPQPIAARRVIVASGIGSVELVRPFDLELPMSPSTVHYGLTTSVVSGQPMPLTLDLDTGLFISRELDGAAVTMFDGASSTARGIDDVLSDFTSAASVRAPALAGTGIRSTFSGTVDTVAGDGQPFVGEFEPDLWTMTGFNGHGTMHGPAVAQFTANLIAGIADPSLDPSVFAPRRTPSASREWLSPGRR